MAYLLTLYLSKLLDVSLETREIDGVPQECIVFPLRKNGIIHEEKSGNVKMRLVMNEKRPNPWRETHYISMMFDKEMKQQYKEYGLFERFLFFGKAKMLFGGKNKAGYFVKEKSVDDILNGH